MGGLSVSIAMLSHTRIDVCECAEYVECAECVWEDRKVVVVAEEQRKKSQGQRSASGSPSQQLGSCGEQLAVQRILQDGYCILLRNFRCRYGEIDIIAEHEGDLVFLEVKTRRGVAYGIPEEAVTPLKVRRMLRAIAYYLSTHEALYSERSWRIDVVAVQMSSAGRLEEIRLYPHAITDIERL